MSAEQASFFFEPVEFDLELPNLLVQLGFEGVLVLGETGAALREDVGQFRQRLFLPLRHLIGMHPVVGGNLVNRLLPFDRLQSDPRFQLGAIGLALLWYALTSRDSSDVTP